MMIYYHVHRYIARYMDWPFARTTYDVTLANKNICGVSTQGYLNSSKLHFNCSAFPTLFPFQLVCFNMAAIIINLSNYTHHKVCEAKSQQIQMKAMIGRSRGAICKKGKCKYELGFVKGISNPACGLLMLTLDWLEATHWKLLLILMPFLDCQGLTWCLHWKASNYKQTHQIGEEIRKRRS